MSDVTANLAGRLATLEAEQRHLLREIDAARRVRDALGDVHLQVRKARTCNPAQGSYPSSGANVYPIVFVDADFQNEAGTRTLNAADRQPTPPTCAFSNSRSHIPVGTVIDVYQCRGLGTETAGDWFILDGLGSDRLYRFRLTADLSLGGVNVAAKVLTYDGTNYVVGETCYVTDWYALTGAPGSTRGMWQGKTHWEGIGLRRERAAGYSGAGGPLELDIVWMETYAWGGEVTLMEDPVFSGTAYASSWSASAIVDKAFHQGIIPGSGSIITVFDDQCMYPFAKSGALAKITRSEYETQNPYYKVLVCQQLALTAKASLSGAMCGTSTAQIANFTVTSPSPFNLASTVTYVANPRGHAGMNGDDVWLAFNKFGPSYEIVDVDLHGVGMLTTLRQSGAWLQFGYKDIFVELCSNAVTYTNGIPMHDFNWWCSGNYYHYCSGALNSGSGSGSGSTGASCDCTTLADTLTLYFSAPGTCWNGQTVTLTKSGSTWSYSGTVQGDAWAFSWACEASGGVLNGTLTVTYPSCITTAVSNPAAIGVSRAVSCDPPMIVFNSLHYLSISGCAVCADVAAQGDIVFHLTA